MSVNKNNNPNDFPMYLFYQGKNYEAYKFFGVHSKKKGRGKDHVFRFVFPVLNAFISRYSRSDMAYGCIIAIRTGSIRAPLHAGRSDIYISEHYGASQLVHFELCIIDHTGKNGQSDYTGEKSHQHFTMVSGWRVPNDIG